MSIKSMEGFWIVDHPDELDQIIDASLIDLELSLGARARLDQHFEYVMHNLGRLRQEQLNALWIKLIAKTGSGRSDAKSGTLTYPDGSQERVEGRNREIPHGLPLPASDRPEPVPR